MSSTSIEFLNNLINLLKDNDCKQCINYLLSNSNIDTTTFNQIVNCFSKIIVEKQTNAFQLGQPSFGISSNQSVSSNSSTGCFDENEFRMKAENAAKSGVYICSKRMSSSSKNPNSFCCKAVKNPNNSIDCYSQVCGTHAPKNRQSNNANVNQSISLGLSNPTNNSFFQPQLPNPPQNGLTNQGFQQNNNQFNQGFQQQPNNQFNQGFQQQHNNQFNQGFQGPTSQFNQGIQAPSLPQGPNNQFNQGIQAPSLPQPPNQGLQAPSLPQPPNQGLQAPTSQPSVSAPSLPFQPHNDQPTSQPSVSAPSLPFQAPTTQHSVPQTSYDQSNQHSLPFQQVPLQFNASGEIQNNSNVNEGKFSIDSSTTQTLSLPDVNGVTSNLNNLSINNGLTFFCRKHVDKEFYFCNSNEELKYLVFELKDGNYLAINGINNGVIVNNNGEELSNSFFGYLGAITEIQKASLTKYGIKYQEKDNFDNSD